MTFIPSEAKQLATIVWRASIWALLAFSRAPWVLVCALDRVLSIAVNFWTLPARVRLAVSDTAVCPRCGRRQSLLGRWRCPICKAGETTSAWASCGICGAKYPAGHISCEAPDCGEAIPNPNLGGFL